MTLKDARLLLDKYIESIKQKENNCLTNCIEIGAELYELKNSSLYMYIPTEDGKQGYDSVYDLIEVYFGYSKSTTNRYINVYKRFANESSKAIRTQFKDYSFSQLCEMLPLTDSQITKCDPSMTCEAIRELKKKDKGKEKVDDFIPDPNTSLQVNFTEEVYDKLLLYGKKQGKHMSKCVLEIVEMFFKSMESGVINGQNKSTSNC